MKDAAAFTSSPLDALLVAVEACVETDKDAALLANRADIETSVDAFRTTLESLRRGT